jgi:hypothetical protein
MRDTTGGQDPRPKLVTMNELHENTAGVIHELHSTQVPFILTRKGRLLALVTPLPEGIEGQLAAEFLADNREPVEDLYRELPNNGCG